MKCCKCKKETGRLYGRLHLCFNCFWVTDVNYDDDTEIVGVPV